MIKLSYKDDVTSQHQPNITARVEFFFHYWKFALTNQRANFDIFFLKSHRTIIEKLLLQIEGNFRYAKPRFVFFFQNDSLFNKKNFIVKNIQQRNVKRAIGKLRAYCRLSNSGWTASSPEKIVRTIKTIDSWLDTEYSTLLVREVIAVLEKDEPVDNDVIASLKQMANCLIVELLHKGFGVNYIKNIPDALHDYRNFPYERMRGEFDSDNEYDTYKKDIFLNLTLKNQIEGIINLLNRPQRTFNVLFKVYNINWAMEPKIILGVEFYNPKTHPKILHKLDTHFFEETFVFDVEKDENPSQCNAIVKVVGTQEEQVSLKGFYQARHSLAILNKEIDANGEIYIRNCFISNANLDILWGSSDALHRGVVRVDSLEDYQIENIKFINNLNPNDQQDKKIINLLSVVTASASKSSYAPEKLWMALEAAFGSEDAIKELTKSLLKLYLKHNFMYEWKVFLINTLNDNKPFASNEDNYSLSQSEVVAYNRLVASY
ncbi:hypothetical protein [Hymenobacter siberiensis]|uniref:hypothetical protein n=1 Tax=Hymenobacter siberiensis TaxID=2848396 RepID=UPI001C1DD385|nr:hypothetical protein [Hymenobacter siberiensis]MBU6122460.1 hypothetical protein [Hymenobacter siberiensis]